jgi:hypothetical protein
VAPASGFRRKQVPLNVCAISLKMPISAFVETAVFSEIGKPRCVD